MRFTVILAVLCAIAMVTVAMRVNKAKRMKKRMQTRAEKHRIAQECNIVSWSDCVDGNITQTVSTNTSNPNCQAEATEAQTATMNCVTTITKTIKRGSCQMTLKHDFTGCQNKGETFTVEKSFTCRDAVTMSKPCSINFAAKHARKMGKNKNKAGNAMKQMKQQKRAFKKELKDLKKKGCIYKPSTCDAATKEQKWTLKKGDAATCKPELVKPCFGGAGKMKKGNRRKALRSAQGKRAGHSTVCKYKSQPWSDCDPVTNKKTKLRTLKRGDPLTCNQTMIVEKSCKRKPRPIREPKCKYKKTQWGECDPETNQKTMVKTLKRGNQKKCAPTQLETKVCKRKFKSSKKTRCAYRGMTKWGQCDTETNTRSRKEALKRGKLKFCQPTRVATKPCKKKSGKKKNKACKYDKSQWSPCDAATNTVTRISTLLSGDPSVCNATKTIVKKCKDRHLRPHLCVYRRSTWGECDPVTNMVSMHKTLKRGDPNQCDATKTVQKKCKRKKKNGKADVCKYSKVQWSECDQASNTMTRTQVLTSGPASCPPTKEFSRKCKKPCKFSQGTWSACDFETQQMTREDTLRKGDPEVCPPTRTLTKKCGKKGKKCQYDHGTWSECDQSDKPRRTRVQKLISGGDNCEPEKVTSKTCIKNSGKERCFFGPWSAFDECQNGVQKKRRQVLQGGLECERKSVKMKSC